MKRVVSFFLAAAMVLVILYLCFFRLPARSVTKEVIAQNGVAYEQKINSVAYGYALTQPFVPQYERLKRLEIYIDAIDCDKSQGVLQMTLTDAQNQVLVQKKTALQDLPEYGWLEFETDIVLSTKEQYALTVETLEALGDGPRISFYSAELAASEEEKGQVLTYAGNPVEDAVLRAEFTYIVPAAARVYLVYAVFLLGMAALVLSHMFSAKASGK